MKKHLYIIGFMGTGKSTVAKLLSEKINLPLLEMDEILSERFDMPINDIFDSLGEDVFRAAESLLLSDIAETDTPSIISCGGGVPLIDENRRILKDSGNTILLTTSSFEIKNRLSNCDDRPLIQDKSEQEIEEMLVKRKAAYDEAANYTISTDDLSPEDVVSAILKLLAGEL